MRARRTEGDAIAFLPAGAVSFLVALTWTLVPSVRNVDDGPPELARREKEADTEARRAPVADRSSE